MLLTVPILEPVALAFGYDQLAFAIVGIIAIEAGLLIDTKIISIDSLINSTLKGLFYAEV